MKIFIILLFPISLFAQKQVEQKSLNPHVVEWLSEKEYEFGLLQQNVPVETLFIFKNISADTITIDNIRTTCGCTAPFWDLEPIPPGDTTEIRIEYNAYKEGYFRKKIKVFFNTQKKGDLLYVEGEVEEVPEELEIDGQ